MKINIIKQLNEVFDNIKIKHLSKNKIRAHYETTNKLAKPKPMILPTYVDVEEDFAEWLGLYIGDGKLTPKDVTHTEFCTIETDMAKFLLDYLRKEFYITNKDISFSIRYRYGNKNKLRNKWSKILNVPKNKLRMKKRYTYKMIDSITIQVNSIIFRKLLRQLIDVSLPIIKKDEILRRGFLRGEFASDGRLGVEKDTNTYYVSEVTFCYDTKKEIWLRDYIIDCLKLESIEQFNSISGYIRITNWGNYLKFWDMKIFDRCVRKKNKFLNVVKQSNAYFQINLKFLNSTIKSLNLTTTQLTKMLGLHRTNLKRVKTGEQLLKIEQVYEILQKSSLIWDDIIVQTKKVRIGKQTYLEPDKKFIDFLINEKDLK